MQLIVLVEYLSHFKSKRAPDNLSDVFITVYDQVSICYLLLINHKLNSCSSGRGISNITADRH
jgi:hypothetical protein